MKDRYMLINQLDIPILYDKKNKKFLWGNEIKDKLNRNDKDE